MPKGVSNKTLEQKIACRNKYLAQFPKYLIVPITPSLTCIQMMIVACIEAEICSRPLIEDCIGLSAPTLHENIAKLTKLKIIQTYKKLYWPTEMPFDEMKRKTRSYWRKTNTISGKRIKGLANRTDHQKSNDIFLEMARKTKKWRTIKRIAPTLAESIDQQELDTLG